jgi:hypothetical protein
MLLGVGVAQAAPPPNDAFSAAQPLAAGGEVSADNLEATAETGEPDPASAAKADSCSTVPIDSAPGCASSVWYVFTAPETTEYTIETCDLGTDVDTVLGVYTGTIGSLATVKDNDDAPECAGAYGTNGSRVSFAATAGTEYRVDVTGFRSERGSFYLRAYAGAAQPRPAPDTGIDREASYAANLLLNLGVDQPGVLSGPRHSPSFKLISEPPGTSFECSLDGAAFSACSSPIAYEGLTPGSSHAFRARAVSGANTDPTPIVERFTIDHTAPETIVTKAPFAEIPGPNAEWEFASSKPRPEGGAFLCGLDSQPSYQCFSPFMASSLCKGAHSFRVSANDIANNSDPTPASAQTSVTSGGACAPPTIGAPVPPAPSATESGEIAVPLEDKGAGGTFHVEYGTTTAYGLDESARDQPEGPSAGTYEDQAYLNFLQPDTTYHYRLTIATPFGSASTPDQTLTTKPLEGGETLPEIVNGTPRVVAGRAAELPFTIDPAGVSTGYRVLISADQPVKRGGLSYAEGGESIPALPGGPTPASAQVVDLDPGHVYHYRVNAYHLVAGGTSVLGPEGTFATPPDAAPLAPISKKRFRLRRGQIKVGPIRRRSKKLRVRVVRLPPRTKVKLRLIARGAKQSARKKARRSGKAIFKMVLSKRIRKALRKPRLKRVRLRFVAITPANERSRVTVAKRVRGRARHRHRSQG